MTFQTIGIIGKHGDPNVAQTVTELAGQLADAGRRVLIDTLTNAAFDGRLDLPRTELGKVETIAAEADLCVVVGGDGTFLGAARDLLGVAGARPASVPLLGVNLGHLGFLTDISPDERREHIEAVLAGDYFEEKRFLLSVEARRDGAEPVTALAFNEAVIHKLNVARLLSIETCIDGKLVNGQRSDALIVATPTGSTAYALSGGGPIVAPELDALVLVPVAPHTLSSRPVVVSSSSKVEVRLRGSRGPEAQLTCDGMNIAELTAAHTVTIRRHASVTLVHPSNYDDVATLRAKLRWAQEL